MACVLALVAVVLGAFLVVGMPWSAGAGTTTAGGPTPASAPVPASPTLPADPAQALETQRGADAAAAEALVGSWAPQLSAKKQGLVVDGQTYDAGTILTDHQRLRGLQPDAILVWSGDFTSFRSSDFWITMANRPFSTAEDANAWCQSAGVRAGRLLRQAPVAHRRLRAEYRDADRLRHDGRWHHRWEPRRGCDTGAR